MTQIIGNVHISPKLKDMTQIIDIIADGKEFRVGFGNVHIGPKLKTQAAAEIVHDWFIEAMPDLVDDMKAVKARAVFITKLITKQAIIEEVNTDCADPTNSACQCRACLKALEESHGP